MKQNKEKYIADLNNYLNVQIKPVFNRLVVELLASQPNDMIQWCVDWLQSKGKDIIHNKTTQHHVDTDSDDHDHEEVDDMIFYTNQKQVVGRNSTRSGVSSEVYGQYNKKEKFVARVIPKKEQQVIRIKQRMDQAFMFSALDHDEQLIVINAMEEKTFGPGEWVIKQGENGDDLYVIDSGVLDCYKNFTKDAEPQLIKTYEPGESFGELALLYNAPRAASIKARDMSICFALDRATFNNIVKESTIKKRQKYDSLISKIDILSSMNSYEQQNLCDAVKEIKYKAGEYVIKEGDEGHQFYMIISGELLALKLDDHGQEQQVFSYQQGDYFGELALIKNEKRKVSIKTTTPVHLIYVEKQSFKRLLGSLEDILIRNTSRYNKYVPQK